MAGSIDKRTRRYAIIRILVSCTLCLLLVAASTAKYLAGGAG